MLFHLSLILMLSCAQAHDNMDAVQRSLHAAPETEKQTPVLVEIEHELRKSRAAGSAKCSQLLWSGPGWGGALTNGIDVSAWTDGEFKFIGSEGNAAFYCNDIIDGIEFGSTSSTMRGLLGTSFSSGSCCSSSNPNGVCNAPDKEKDVQKLCEQLGYSVGTLVEREASNSCPEVEFIGGKWSSDFYNSVGAGRRFKCTGRRGSFTCKCENGEPAIGDACPSQDANTCSKCDDGFHDVDKFCLENLCKCEHGSPATGTACTSHNAKNCKSCDDGFHPAGKACLKNQCQCEHGTPAEGIACTDHGSAVCVKCDETYYRDGQSCRAKMRCTDTAQGFVNLGDAISSDSNKYAKSCPVEVPKVLTSAWCGTGVCLVNPDRQTCCRANVCTCSMGAATVAAKNGGAGGTLCETDDTEDCSACNDGYHLTADAALGLQTCVPNTCTCPNGQATVATGVMGTFCGQDGQHDCSSCHDGYRLSGAAGAGSQQCLPNTCTCPGGVPSVATGSGGTLCKVDNTQDCSSCHAGYTISAPADENLQSCEPNTCEKNNLPAGREYDLSGCSRAMATDRTCAIGCTAGYTGADTTWTCQSSGQLHGDPPTCEAQKCNEKLGSQMFTSHVSTHNCSNASTHQTCVATCNDGYSGESQTYTCESDGYAGKSMHCKANPCDASHDVANGKSGDCTDSLDSGRQCTITCNEGYTRKGVTSCLAGSLTSVASCEPNPCDASEHPAYGTAGDCTSSLESSKSCQPTCGEGYKVSGPSQCDKGVLTAATCKADLQCELIYKQDCEDMYGYWSDEEKHLDYPGCEHFCNMMYLAHGKTVKGCELAAVPGSARSTKGKWCFAHEEECALGERNNNAASKCVPLVDME